MPKQPASGELAQLPCPQCRDGYMEHVESDGVGGADRVIEPCANCNGTGLRYPALSRECNARLYEGHARHEFCNGTRRVPTVTLEKIVPMLLAEGGWMIHPTVEGKVLLSPGAAPYIVFEGPSFLEAAADALLKVRRRNDGVL